MGQPPRPADTRSPKAGRPAPGTTPTPQGRRRQKRATGELRKGAMLLQSSRGPRALTTAKGPKRGKQKKG